MKPLSYTEKGLILQATGMLMALHNIEAYCAACDGYREARVKFLMQHGIDGVRAEEIDKDTEPTACLEGNESHYSIGSGD